MDNTEHLLEESALTFFKKVGGLPCCMDRAGHLLEEPELTFLINEILKAKQGIPARSDPSLCPSLELLDSIDFETLKAPIETFSDRTINLGYTGEFTVSDSTLAEDEGVLLGRAYFQFDNNPINPKSQGFELWLLRNRRFGLHLFYSHDHTSGRLEGIGYTGSEQTDFFYDTPLRRTVHVSGKGEILLEQAVAKEGYFLLQIGPTRQELEMRHDSRKRDEFWRNQLRCPDGFISPHDSIIIPDPEWVVVSGQPTGRPFIAGPIRASEAAEGMYNTQGVFERCYDYVASINIRKVLPLSSAADKLRLEKNQLRLDTATELIDRLEKGYAQLENYPGMLPRIAVGYDGVCVGCSNVWLEAGDQPDFNHCQPMLDTAETFKQLQGQQREELLRLIERGVKCPFYHRK